MYSSPFTNNLHQNAPSQFKENARNAIYNQIPTNVQNEQQLQQKHQYYNAQPSNLSIKSAPTQPLKSSYKSLSRRSTSSSSSIFSSFTNGKRSIRSAPSIYSSSTGTIPEDSEPITATVDQLLNDIALHEEHFRNQYEETKSQQRSKYNNSSSSLSATSMAATSSRSSASSEWSSPLPHQDSDAEELYKISLGSNLTYQNNQEESFLIDWNLNVTRCKLILINLPMISSVTNQPYNQNFPPHLIGDLAQLCHLIIVPPHITDKELIFTLIQSNIYQEHNLDLPFRKSVAEISVKQSRLLQVNSMRQERNGGDVNYQHHEQFLKFKYKEIAVRNYLINLAAAATTAHEYKLRVDEIKKSLKNAADPTTGAAVAKRKMNKDDKKVLWDQVRSNVFKRAGLEE
ncbi:uncharacterized protein LODBEIA_P32370 [Lodderomyces beijingensis]|uniref:Uncharacterized protein n=1 Tax=Lodderomyces beijingensis TaxID=1775926 RepID=A0ABP0ZLH9_9ASCO